VFVGYAVSLIIQITVMVMHVFHCLMNVSKPLFTEIYE